MKNEVVEISNDFLKSWDIATTELGVPEHFYDVKLRIIKGDDFSFALILNPPRESRPNFKDSPSPILETCVLCNAVEETQKNKKRILMETENFIFTPNKFPTIRGSSIAYHNKLNENSKPMYRTNNLKDLEIYLKEYLEISRKTGLRIFHNSPGAGASIPNHEHSNFHNFSTFYKKLGEIYGFEGAEYEKVRGTEGIERLVNFPFTNLVFQEDPERIVSFLRKLENSIGYRFEDRGVPHGLIQGKDKILFVPAKIYIEGKGTGAGDMAGHLLTSSEQEFSEANYDSCINRLGKTLFQKEEIDIERLV